MPNWSEVLHSIEQAKNLNSAINSYRIEYIKKIEQLTGRNVITYYSAWLRGPRTPNTDIDEQDKNAFMNAIYRMDRKRGLLLILHTPGGDIAATEGIVEYLQSMFGGDVHAVVPQICMSAGTMIAMSCRKIIMGKQSALGPIDPQLNGVACQSVLEEFDKAVEDIRMRPSSLGLWQAIISKYHPTYLTECRNAIKWSESLARKWLNAADPGIDVDKLMNVFLNHKGTFTHNRRINRDNCIKAGLLTVESLEDDHMLQDAVLSLHHTYMIFFDKFLVSKVVENSLGSSYLRMYSLPAMQ